MSLTVLLGVLLALTPLGTDTFLPAMPAVADAFGAPVAATQLAVTTFFMGIAIGQLCWGPLSDRFGRKPVLYTGLGFALVATLVGLAATSVQEVVLVRLAQGLGLSSGPVLARAIVRDLYAHELAARLLSRMMLVFAVVPIGAPLLGAVLVAYGGWPAVFWGLGAITLVVLAGCVGLRESAPAERQSIHPLRILENFRAILGERRFVAPFLVMLSTQMGIFAFVSGSAFAFTRAYGVEPGFYGVLFATVMLGQIAGSWLNNRLVMRFGTGRLLRFGAGCAMVAGISVSLAAWSGVAHWSVLVAPFMLYLFAASMTIPNGQAAALTPFPRMAGAASSLIGATGFALGACVSALIGALFDGTARPMAAFATLGGCAAFCFERWLARPVLQWKA
jgi:DHA1 family bicyclomycin/chloramphenicol resistance-like MFS transporter